MKEETFADRYWRRMTETYGQTECLFHYHSESKELVGVYKAEKVGWIEIIWGPPMVNHPHIPSGSTVRVLDKAGFKKRERIFSEQKHAYNTQRTGHSLLS